MNTTTKQYWTDEYGVCRAVQEPDDVEWRGLLDDVSRFCPSNTAHRLDEESEEEEGKTSASSSASPFAFTDIRERQKELKEFVDEVKTDIMDTRGRGRGRGTAVRNDSRAANGPQRQRSPNKTRGRGERAGRPAGNIGREISTHVGRGHRLQQY
jgi:hypothetical protein